MDTIHGRLKCISVVTYNTETNLRSLCHLPGGQYESLIPQLADIIDESTVVLFTNGTSGSREWLESQKDNIIGAIVTRLAADGKEGGFYRLYYIDPSKDGTNGLVAGTFVIKRHGRYGRIQAQQGQEQGQVSSRGLHERDSGVSRGNNPEKRKEGMVQEEAVLLLFWIESR